MADNSVHKGMMKILRDSARHTGKSGKVGAAERLRPALVTKVFGGPLTWQSRS